MSIEITDTLKAFGYPGSLLKAYDHWVVLLRPKQPTLGAMVLAIQDDIRRFPDVPAEAFAELATITAELEGALKATTGFDKMNYIQLGMVDPQIHFHVLPRYETPRAFAGSTFPDAGWPAQPKMGEALDLSDAQMAELREALKAAFP